MNPTAPNPQSPSDPIRGKATSFQRIRNFQRESLRNVTRRQVRLDWKGYFLNFCKAHGEPIVYNNVLLFRDGWTYAMDYKGPEYPPPSDHQELDRLVTSYWLSRLRVTKGFLAQAISERDKYVLLSKSHSLPLQQTMVITEGEHRRTVTSPFDLTPLDERIRWFRQDLQECEMRLKELEEYHKEWLKCQNQN
jgi:hypothetical protein